MSIALERIGQPGLAGFGDPTAAEAESCTSSIGRNSDSSGGGSDGGEESEEVQSSLKGPLDTMDALEDSLPIRRGISKFYCGKSKSFTSLADAQCCSSSRGLAKSENSYTRKRKSLLTFSSTLWDKTCSNSLRYDEDSAVSKRPANSSRTTVGRGHPETAVLEAIVTAMEAVKRIMTTTILGNCLPCIHVESLLPGNVLHQWKGGLLLRRGHSR